jgi:hypothetical protein
VTPNPGSREAIDQGCLCAKLDNGMGRGRYGDGERYGWWITGGCPLHAPNPAVESEVEG